MCIRDRLQKEPIADEQKITELIAGYKANTRKSLGRLVVIQRFSIGIGTICLATLLPVSYTHLSPYIYPLYPLYFESFSLIV